MPHPVDRAAAVIAKEWATFSNKDLCGHEISLARALHRAGMLAADGLELDSDDPPTINDESLTEEP